MMGLFGEAHESTHRLIDAHLKAAELGAFQETTQDGQATVVATLHEGSRLRRDVRGTRDSDRAARRPRLRTAATALAALATVGTVGWLVWAQVHSGGAPQAPATALAPSVAPAPSAPAPPACAPGFKPCDGQCVSTDRPDVGCGRDDCSPCDVPNATPRCNGRHACDIAVCYSGYDNCDGDLRNGCEAEVLLDPGNCGACGRKCAALPHARVACGATCTIWRCDDGFHDCNGLASDGCEVRTTDDAKNCGHCGAACARGLHCRSGRCVP